jgi:hypothetical protein
MILRPNRLNRLVSLSLVVICSGCGPKWETPDETKDTVQGSVFLFEPGPSHQVGQIDAIFWKVPIELQPVRRVAGGKARYTVRFTLGGNSWEEEEATMRNLVVAYDAYKGKKSDDPNLIVNSWVSVQGTSGVFEYSLLDDEMNINTVDVGKAAAFVKAVKAVLDDLTRMKDVDPAVNP